MNERTIDMVVGLVLMVLAVIIVLLTGIYGALT